MSLVRLGVTFMVKIYDNFLPNDISQTVFNFVIKSYFKIGWEDSEETQHRAYPNLHSNYSEEDLKQIKILDPVMEVMNVNKNQYQRCIVNLTKPMDVNFIHMHPDQIVALYYANISWSPEWGGETLFYEADRKTIGLASPYVPNRLVVFDGKIPHTIKAQNLIGPSYRFTVSLFFNKHE